MRLFGFDWTLDWDYVEIEGIGGISDFGWYTEDTTISGGAYYIIHNDGDGTFYLMEMGGRGPDVWDREILDSASSPMEAMKAARDDYRQEEREYDAWLLAMEGTR